MLTGRRVAIAVICGIAVVFGLAGWRYFTGESPRPAIAKTVSSTPATAPPPAPVVDSSAALNQLEGAQQVLVDDLQLLQDRVTAQDAEITKLRGELQALGQKFEALSSFASTAKETRPAAAEKPDNKSRPASRAKTTNTRKP
ncbi:hypothetical protein [Bradyrhizobium sp. LHD-71]|uniref:hypothetical protein n=1 Tax=Bradyrhizobium sp. LHD-71 TaxID=3072141 RepID=UPI00280CBFDF|nr:hypothetical protein [Bradyrhizobium sp. LHD-71]MDQ8729473.1 hypothetical protein [Bradyrhizobium sp. LHD-71]